MGNDHNDKVSSDGSDKKLIRGDYGLPATFWGWGVGATFVLAFFLGSILDSAGSDDVAYIVMAVFFCYSVVVSIAIWRASDQYKGPVHWGVLSKIAVIFTGGLVLLVNLYVVAMLASPPMH